MFTYYLASQISDIVTGYGLVCGEPMIGWLNNTKKAAESMMISFHGRDDGVLPPQGGVDDLGMWIYESLDDTFAFWGS